ncbi:MAG: helix-turn-helix domain-containing protein [Lachnospiraceae bacterium]|nr:helix-turn-helix domain-containing protein [Lachnospiraceae bacterium]
MTKKELETLPLSPLEAMLKKCFLLRPDIQKKILEADELSAYILWLIRTFSDDPEYQLSDDILPYATGGKMAELGKQILTNPTDKNALTALFSGYSIQQEDQYIIADHDISVGRMLRYMPSHWHGNSYIEVYYAFSGNCSIHFRTEEILLKKGTVLIVAPGAVHASPCYSDDKVLLYYMLRTSTFDQVFWNQLPSDSLMSSFFRRALSNAQPNSYIRFETGEDPEISDLLVQLYNEFLEKRTYHAQLMNSLMTTFFILMLRRYEGTARLPRNEDLHWKHEFSAILSYIQKNYTSASLNDVASRFHYSDRQVSRIVKNCTGETYAQLTLRLRMEKAANMLRNGAASAKTAEACGYSTLSSFYRAFYAYFRCTPGTFTG